MALPRCNQYLDRAACIRRMTAGTPTLNSLADFVSNDADGVTINWTTNDGTGGSANTICYLFLGDKVAVRIPGMVLIQGRTLIT